MTEKNILTAIAYLLLQEHLITEEEAIRLRRRIQEG